MPDSPPQPPSPNVHCLKCIEPYFSDVLAGRKKFEIRKNDRGFKVGDVLRLEAYDPERREYTGSRMDFRVGYMIEGAPYLPEGLCVMQLVDVPVVASAQPPSPAQRIEQAIDGIRMNKEGLELGVYSVDNLNFKINSALATVRAALKEMEEHFHRAHTEGIDAVVKALTERHKEEVAGIIAQEKEDAKAVARIEALRPSPLECKADPRKEAFDDAIVASLKALKGDQA